MAGYDDFDSGGRNRGGGDTYGFGGVSVVKLVVIAVLAIAIAIGGFVWFVCRIEVGKGELVTVMRKTGKDITNEQLFAPSPDYRGPQFEVLKEGRHFKNPYTWWWKSPLKAISIPKDRVGILVRRHGKRLPHGQFIARSTDQKGIVAQPLLPGRHYINPWEYHVNEKPMVKIEPGFKGVVTLLVGKMPEDSNVFVVGKGERGTQPELLEPGTHPEYSNPYVHMVTPIDVRSRKFEMAGEYKITFLSKFGFDIEVEGTIEWAPEPPTLPELFVKYVDSDDLKKSGGINNIQRKIILPYARSFFRTVGGQYRAVDYITGTTRVEVQTEVQRRLRQACAKEGIVVRSFVIRSTKPPSKIREQYERREIAKRQIDRFEKEIETEIGSMVFDGSEPKRDEDGEIVREGGRLMQLIQKHRHDRESKLGRVREDVRQKIRAAEQYAKVLITKANEMLEVARLKYEAASDEAEAVRAAGTAEAAVTVMRNEAEAEAVRAKVSAFGTGGQYAENLLIQALAPGITEILSNTDESSPFARLFERFTSQKRSE